jgi:hypothetical protein
MQKSTSGLIVLAVIITAVTFLLGPILLPPKPPSPPQSLLPAFIFLSFWDALAFGVGIAFLIYLGRQYPKWPKSIRTPLLLISLGALFFSIPNWIHDGLHMAGADSSNYQLLVIVEYLFHFPWLIFATIFIVAIMKLVKAYPK